MSDLINIHPADFTLNKGLLRDVRSEQLAPIHPAMSLEFRLATFEDIEWMDALQKRHSNELGYFPTKQFEGYVQMGGALISTNLGGRRLGYCISRDRYLKRDELGVVYQMCVEPEARRSLVAGALLKEVFARSAYGCRLYCCWCAQDLPANRFWEAMGFVPVAFRGGGEKKGKKSSPRVHIFWQKRIVHGDVTTPWWFPSKTDGGAMRGDRIVLPIPPGVRWDDSMPVMIQDAGQGADEDQPEQPRRERAKRLTKKQKEALLIVELAKQGVQQPTKRQSVRFGPPGMPVAVEGLLTSSTIASNELIRSEGESTGGMIGSPNDSKSPCDLKQIKARGGPKRPTTKCDPKIIAAARELRDRYLEQINSSGCALMPAGKYELSKLIASKSLGSTVPELLQIAA